MIRIPCPHCGTRDHSEFTYHSTAAITRPTGDDATEWSHYLYLRDNPRGVSDELWQHVHGCRSWLVVTRNTLTHEVHGARLASAESES